MENDSKIDDGAKKDTNAKTGGAGTGGGAGAVAGGAALGAGAPAQPGHSAQPTSPYYPYYSYTGPYYYPTYQAPPVPKRRRSSKPDIVGALLVVAGVLSIIMGMTAGMFFLGVGGVMNNMGDMMDDTGDVSGHVIAYNATPLDGATITVMDSGQQVISNATGYFRIIGVETGWHDFRVEKAGYRTIIQSINVMPNPGNNWNHDSMMGDEHSEHDDSTTIDFQLQPGSDTYRVGSEHKGDWNTQWSDFSTGWGGVFMGVCSLLIMVFGILAVIGGVFAFRRKHLAVVFMGAIFGIISIGFVLGAVLSILALIVLLLSMDEFNGQKHLKGKRIAAAGEKDFVEEDE